jgi:hypothetical protein
MLPGPPSSESPEELQRKIRALETELKSLKKEYVDGVLTDTHITVLDSMKYKILLITEELNSYKKKAKQA